MLKQSFSRAPAKPQARGLAVQSSEAKEASNETPRLSQTLRGTDGLVVNHAFQLSLTRSDTFGRVGR